MNGTAGGDYVRTFRIDTTPPIVSTVVESLPAFRNTPVASVTFQFSKPVRNVGLSDFTLRRNGTYQRLTGSQSVIPSTDFRSWTLQGLSSVTMENGLYQLTLTPAHSLIEDFAGNPLVSGLQLTWTMDTLAPTVQITPVTPDPRVSSVSAMTLTFSEEVQNFTLADLTLTRNGTVVPLSGAVLSTSNNIHWTLSNLAPLTAMDGLYALAVHGLSGLRDRAGNALAYPVYENWRRVTTPPLLVIVPVSPDPRNTSVSRLDFYFDRPVVGFTALDVSLKRNSSHNLLTGTEQLVTIDNMHYALTGLAGLTALEGQYTVTVIAGGSGIQDLAGNLLVADSTEQWITDLTSPVLLDIVDVTPDPRNTFVAQIVLNFSELVVGLDISDITLQRDTGSGLSGNLLSATQQLTTTSGMSWTLSGLASITGIPGTYLLTLNTSGSGIVDTAGNPLNVGGTESWLMETTSPTVSMVAVSPDPSPVPISTMTIVFSELVQGFDVGDLTLRRNGGPNLLTGNQSLSTANDITFVLGNLAALTAVPGEYELSLRAFGSQIRDLAGNYLVAGTFEAFRVGLPGDFNLDGQFNCADVNALTAVIAAGSHQVLYDLTGDQLVNAADLTQWLALAGAANLASGNPYLPADADLDGDVDLADFVIWNAHKFTFNTAFCSGNFNADLVIDGADFNIWNLYKNMSSEGGKTSFTTRRLDGGMGATIDWAIFARPSRFTDRSSVFDRIWSAVGASWPDRAAVTNPSPVKAQLEDRHLFRLLWAL